MFLSAMLRGGKLLESAGMITDGIYNGTDFVGGVGGFLWSQRFSTRK